MDSPVEKGTAVPKSPGSAKKVRPTTPGVAPAQDEATKPTKHIKKKKPKMQKLDDATSKADSVQGSDSQLQEPPQQVNNHAPKTPDAKKSPSQSAPDVGGQDKFKALDSQGGNSAKKVIKKKKPSLPAQVDDKDEEPEQTQKPIDQGKKKKLRLPAEQSSPDNLEPADQLNKKVKKGTERPDSRTLNNEEPEKVDQLKENTEKNSQKFKPSVSQIDDAPKPIKKKIKKPTPPPAPEPESEPEPEPEHEDEEETESEHEGEEETESDHDNDVDSDEAHESDDENESEEEVEKAPEDKAPEEEDDDDEDEHKHGHEEEEQEDNAAKTDVLGNENVEKKVHDTTEVVAEPEKIFSDDVAQNVGDVSGEADDASGQAQDKADGVATETKDSLGKVQNAVGSLAKEGAHATEEAANKLSPDAVKGLIGKKVNDSGEVIDESGRKLGKATGDYPSMAGKSINDAGEITDAGKVVGRVSQVEEHQAQDGIAIKGFMPGMEQSGSVNAHGIQINVQSTKDGVSVTINIPGVFQQQQQQ